MSLDDGARARFDTFAMVFMLAQQLTRRADGELAPFDLTTSQWLLLAVLTRRFAGHAPSLGEASAVFGSSRQNTRQVAQQLERRGYVELRADPRDRRVVRLHVTPKVRLFDRTVAVKRQLAFVGDIFGALDDAEVAQLEALLRRWLAGLEAPSDRAETPVIGRRSAPRKGPA